jgi:hypothetical protein
VVQRPRRRRQAGARKCHRGGAPIGHAGLFRSDARSAPQRSGVHGRRQRRHGACRRHQRRAGARALPGARPGRPARRLRSRSRLVDRMAHDRRRGRQRASEPADAGAAHRDVRTRGAGSV